MFLGYAGNTGYGGAMSSCVGDWKSHSLIEASLTPGAGRCRGRLMRVSSAPDPVLSSPSELLGDSESEDGLSEPFPSW